MSTRSSCERIASQRRSAVFSRLLDFDFQLLLQIVLQLCQLILQIAKNDAQNTKIQKMWMDESMKLL